MKGSTFKFIQISLSIIFIPLICMVFGASLVPGILLTLIMLPTILNSANIIIAAFLIGFSLAFTFMLFGITQILIVGLIYRILPIKIKPGTYPIWSSMTIKWGLICAFCKMVRLTFLDFVTPSFLNILFFKMLGAKIGKNVQINTISINDPWLMEINDDVIIGGDCSINGHTFEYNKLILKKISLKHHVVIGASVMIWQGVEIGQNSAIASQSLILKNTKIPENQIWAGSPAKFLKTMKINNSEN